MDKQELIEKIIAKKEFSQLPKKDVEMAFGKFDEDKYGDEEKVKLTRELLHKVFGVFTSRKLLSPKEKDVEWILRKHVSTRERLPYYGELYERILNLMSVPRPTTLPAPAPSITIIDLGAGINGFSYEFLSASVPPTHPKLNYVAIEATGQLVDLMNDYFKREKLSGKAIHMSLFDLEKVKKIIKQEKGKKIVFLFKTLDSLEMVERDYSKKLLKEITPLVENVVVSFAVKSIGKRERFRANRKWLMDFVNEEFKVLDDFEIGGERYIVFSK